MEIVLIAYAEPYLSKCIKVFFVSDLSAKTCVMGAQKSHLMEMVLMSTHDIYLL